MEKSLRMRVEQEAAQPRFLSRNAGKLIAAFVAGFAVFVAIAFQVPSRQTAITSSPIRQDISLAAELPTLVAESHAPVLFLPNLNLPAATTANTRRRPRKEQQQPESAIERTVSPPVVRDVAASEPQPAAMPPAEPEVKRQTIPAESPLAVRLAESLTTKENRTGDVFRGVLASPLMAEGALVFPQGSAVQGRIVEARRAGLFGRRSVLSLELTSISAPDGHAIAVKTTQWYANGSGSRLKVPFRGKGKENGAQAMLPESKGSDVSVPANAAVTFRLMTPAAAR